MGLRMKIALAFSGVLTLTLLITATAWWGLDRAMQRQRALFNVTVTIDRIFNEMSHEEHLFVSTKAPGHAARVKSNLKTLHATVVKVQQYFPGSQPELVGEIIDHLAIHEKSFESFSAAIIDFEALQSRLVQESNRLIAKISALPPTRKELALGLSLQMEKLQQAQMEFLLFGGNTQAVEMGKLAREIKTIGERVLDSTRNGSERLPGYRIARNAKTFLSVFNRYSAKKDLTQKLNQYHHESGIKLESQLRAFIDHELAVSQDNTIQLKYLTLAVSFSAAALAFLATILLSRKITRPIEKLKDSARAIQLGDLGARAKVESRDEIGQLGMLFNEMAEKLQTSFDEIVTYRDHLEEKISDRTAELQREVNERGATERMLRAREEQLQTIVDNSPMGIILWDTNFRVVQWNPAAQEIFGYSGEEAAGLHAAELLPKEVHPHMEKIWQKMIAAPGGIRSHNENIKKDGSTIRCDWFNTAVIGHDNQVLGGLSLVENVTERIRREKELRKLEKLESTGILAGGIAHDFNNILTAILGNLNLALYDPTLPDRTKKLLQGAEKASIRAKSLTQQLLTFAKGGEPIRESTSLGELITDSAEFVLHGTNIRSSFLIPEDLWHASVDRGQISQVIQNIVLNARHAMPGGGEVVIWAENIAPSEDEIGLLQPNTPYVRISIGDSGTGIPKDLLDKIFDPYFSTKQEGSGLGLAITLSIINKHNGHILVHSTPGEGTEFVLYLIADSQSDREERSEEGTSAPIESLHILVMDDEEPVRDILKSMLEMLHHRVCLTSSGEEAVEEFERTMDTEQSFDLVIMDLTIPGGMGGRDAMELMKKMQPGVRGIVSSGYSNDPVMSNPAEYGFKAAVTKPFVIDELEKALWTALTE